jgi:hypothetical protein
MPTDRLTGTLALSDRERGLLEALLDSLAAAAELRLPPELVLVGVGLEVGRPDDWATLKSSPRDRAHTGSAYH